MRKKTNEVFMQEVIDLVGDEYTPLDAYQLSNKNIRMKHNTCGTVYEQTPNNFLNGKRCPNCNGNNARRKTTEEFKKEVFNLVGNEYTVLGEYINRSTNIRVRHNTCGKEYLVLPHNFLSRSRCIECYHSSLRLSKEDVEDRIRNSLDDSYKLASEYVSLQKTSKVKHEVCGNTFNVRISDIIQKKSSCPYCSQSVGEQQVASYLRNKNIEFMINKKFDDLKNKRLLSYDFYLPKLNVLIEFQGEQHFVPKTFGGITVQEAKKRLELQKYHDSLKRQYAKDIGYTLLEPNYKLNTFDKVSKFLDDNLHC